MARPFLSVIIPAYNEADRIPLTVVDVDRHLSTQDFSYEIIIALSPSDDNTETVLDRFSGIIKNLKVIKLEKNLGKGYAVRTGMLAAKGNRRLQMDADNSVAIVEFDKFLPYLSGTVRKEDQYDIVVGSRFIAGAKASPIRPWYRKLASFSARLLITLLGLGVVKDSQCGFLCFTADAAEKVFPQITTNGWMSDLEALLLSKKAGLKVKEVPIFYAHNPGSKIRPHHYLASLAEVIRIRFRMMRV